MTAAGSESRLPAATRPKLFEIGLQNSNQDAHLQKNGRLSQTSTGEITKFSHLPEGLETKHSLKWIVTIIHSKVRHRWTVAYVKETD
jgi:hypothetical protein